MATAPTVLCPIDFSDMSRAALCYGAAIANHLGARLTLLAVEDPLLAEVAATTGLAPSLRSETEGELRKLLAETLPEPHRGPGPIETRVEVGKPAPRILQAATDLGAELIVMSSHGRSGVRKMFFGSTTERVLRETRVPVLVTPDGDTRVMSLEEASHTIRRIIVPVDLTGSSPRQVGVAAGIASFLSIPLIITYVLEPVFVPPRIRTLVRGSDALRREYAERHLVQLVTQAGLPDTTETMVVSGEPSEEIVKLATTRNAGLIVMGLHSSGVFGPRMGSVTYRVLCLTPTLVLALPPAPSTAAHEAQGVDLAHVVV